jgi:hypothetical protein
MQVVTPFNNLNGRFLLLRGVLCLLENFFYYVKINTLSSAILILALIEY